MTLSRLEALSDGVIAIFITVTVLDLRVPHGSDLAALLPFAPLLEAKRLTATSSGRLAASGRVVLKPRDPRRLAVARPA